jgi:hypothetical protein
VKYEQMEMFDEMAEMAKNKKVNMEEVPQPTM